MTQDGLYMKVLKNSNLNLSSLKKAKGIIFDFDGVFTDNSVILSEDGKEHVRCSRLDGLGLKKIREANIPSCVISSEINKVVESRCQKLLIECFSGVGDKVAKAIEWSNIHRINLEDVIFLGNDINDIPLLCSVGFPAVVSDCHNDVLDHAFFQTTHSGGNGAVRELCDFIA